MTPTPNDAIRHAGSPAAVRSSEREPRARQGVALELVVVAGLIIEGLLPIGSIDGEDQTLH